MLLGSKSVTSSLVYFSGFLCPTKSCMTSGTHDIRQGGLYVLEKRSSDITEILLCHDLEFWVRGHSRSLGYGFIFAFSYFLQYTGFKRSLKTTVQSCVWQYIPSFFSSHGGPIILVFPQETWQWNYSDRHPNNWRQIQVGTKNWWFSTDISLSLGNDATGHSYSLLGYGRNASRTRKSYALYGTASFPLTLSGVWTLKVISVTHFLILVPLSIFETDEGTHLKFGRQNSLESRPTVAILAHRRVPLCIQR